MADSPKSIGILKRLRWPAWLDRLAGLGIVSDDPDVVRRQRFVNLAGFVGAADTLSHAAYNSLYDFNGLLPINIYNVAMAALMALTPLLHRYGQNFGALYLVGLIGLGNLYVIWSLGFEGGTVVYYTTAGAVFFILGVANWRAFVWVLAFAFLLLAVSVTYAPEYGPVLPGDQEFRRSLTAQALFATLTINTVLIVYALLALNRAEKALAAEHERSEQLLSAILPQSVAARLKSEPEKRIAERIDAATIVFIDLVGFTRASRARPPGEIVSYLDGLVRRLDRLAGTHGIEKIKTIGDCYMAAGGLEGEGRDGAVAAGHFALEALDTVRNGPALAGVLLNIRVGIHTGATVAGVIGTRRYAYDIWGEAVNVAARMEQTGEPGRIHVSQDFIDATGGVFAFEPRGPVEVKGVGRMETSFLVRAHAGAGEDVSGAA
jgi:adenylate cyclase